MIQRLFVYGTLAPGRPNEHLLAALDGSWEEATVTGTLHAEGWGAALGYPALVLDEEGDEIEGFLFSSEALGDHWSRLDEFEGEAYERVSTVVKLGDGRTVDAHVYALKDERMPAAGSGGSEPRMTRPAKTEMLRHTLAALAYRTQKALRDAPPAFADYRVAANVRTPHELVWHMTGVIGYAISLYRGTAWRPDRLESFEAELQRFHATLAELAERFALGALPEGTTAEQLLQGPLADALTHAGQLAMLRRLQGSPVPPENFLLADIDTSNVGPEQAPPRAPKAGWRPDQPPPSPGRPLV